MFVQKIFRLLKFFIISFTVFICFFSLNEKVLAAPVVTSFCVETTTDHTGIGTYNILTCEYGSTVTSVPTIKTFNVSPGDIVKITSADIDDKGTIKINGVLVLSRCNNWNDCPDPDAYGSYFIEGSTVCNGSVSAVTFPYDITSYLHTGSNTFEIVDDNCGGGHGGFYIYLETTTPPPTCNLFSSETGVFSGGTVELSWDVSPFTTTSAILKQNGTAISTLTVPPNSGSITSSSITGSTNFTLDVTGPGGTASCGPVGVGILVPPIGGLVPCGRLADNPATGDIDESQPCNLCSTFYMLKNVINYAMTLAIGLAVFILVISGLLYALSTGDSRKIDMAKKAITSALIGVAIIFIAWLVIAIILQSLGYANMTTWNQVNCNL